MLDGALEEAIAKVTRDAGQPESVARRLIAWLRRMSEMELVKEDNARFLSDVCHEIRLVGDDED